VARTGVTRLERDEVGEGRVMLDYDSKTGMPKPTASKRHIETLRQAMQASGLSEEGVRYIFRTLGLGYNSPDMNTTQQQLNEIRKALVITGLLDAFESVLGEIGESE
jgi:ATP-dependent RNA circularization protein (DNA/RNA ligase family)